MTSFKKLKAVFTAATLAAGAMLAGCGRDPAPAAPDTHDHKKGAMCDPFAADRAIAQLIAEHEERTAREKSVGPRDLSPNDATPPPAGYAPGSTKGEKLDENGVRRRDLLKAHMKQEVFAKSVLSMATAIHLAESGNGDSKELSTEQKYLVQIVTELRRTAAGRTMTDLAAKSDVWMCIDNYALGSAYYSSRLDVLSIELKDDGNTAEWDTHKHDETAASNFRRALQRFTGIAYHELVHYMQFEVWDNATPPPGTRSFDVKVWEIMLEAQANVMRDNHALLEKYSGQKIPADIADRLYRSFVESIMDAEGHLSAYGFENGKTDDGKKIDIAYLTATLGQLPGVDGNFLEGRHASLESFYDATIGKNSRMRDHYRHALRQAEERARGDAVRNNAPPVTVPPQISEGMRITPI